MKIKPSKLVFWDFDGVIKDSVEVKTQAFERLFQGFHDDLLKRVRIHHEAHGGMSRFDKIPLYMHWAGLPVDSALVGLFLAKFSEIVFQGVVDAPWVPGAKEYLLSNYKDSYFVLLTATPEDEIIGILNQLGISCCFKEIHGSPKIKKNVVFEVLMQQNVKSSEALLIGDSEVDFLAAQVNSVPFLLRRTLLNKELQDKCIGNQFEYFKNE
uniref:HAD family hydrolase n=1 Tax=Polynucleobacter sp. TaxID=2029855 RepID=UPI0040480614